MVKDNIAEVHVGPFLKKWLIHSGQSEPIVLNKQSNLWGIIASNLELLPADYKHNVGGDEFIQVQLLELRGRKIWNKIENRSLYQESLYRCYISETGASQVRKYLMAQFREIFRAYMIGYCSNPDNKILDGITDFLMDYGLDVDKTTLERLMKDWYRFRKRNEGKMTFSIFF